MTETILKRTLACLLCVTLCLGMAPAALAQDDQELFRLESDSEETYWEEPAPELFFEEPACEEYAEDEATELLAAAEEPVVAEEPAAAEEPVVVEEYVVAEEPVVEETELAAEELVIEEEPAAEPAAGEEPVLEEPEGVQPAALGEEPVDAGDTWTETEESADAGDPTPVEEPEDAALASGPDGGGDSPNSIQTQYLTLKVGDTRTLTASCPYAVTGYAWTSNNIYAVVVESGAASSMCTIRVVDYFSSTVIVRCDMSVIRDLGGTLYGSSEAVDYMITIEKPSYRVTLDPAGGSVSPTWVSVEYDGTYGELPTPWRENYNFSGWHTASGTYVTTGSKIASNSDHTLRAYWTEAKNTVSYNANGGSGAPGNQTKKKGETLTLSTVKPTRQGYTFKGWATTADAASPEYQPGDSYSENKDLTLYAVWKAIPKPTIKTQPTGATVTAGGSATFKITAGGSGLRYQWQYRTSSSGTWSNSSFSGAKTAALTVPAAASRHGYQYRCKVSNGGGTVTSNAVTLKVRAKITVQPANVKAAPGDKASFWISADGKNLSYQWQYRKSDGSWASVTASDIVGAKTASMTVPVKTSRNGCQYRCKVSNSAGAVYSGAVTLTVTSSTVKPSISAQPISATGTEGGKASFSISASGTKLSYQWQYRKSDGSWASVTASDIVGAKTATMTVPAKVSRDGSKYRCVVKNSAGTATSNTVTFTVKLKAPTISSGPSAKTVAAGSTASFKVTAAGSRLSYQWQYRTSANGSWSNSTLSGSKTAALSVYAKSSRDGYQYRCRVKNSTGTVYSKAATLTVVTKPVIVTQPSDKNVSENVSTTFSVTADGKNLSYQWQYRTSSSGTWKNSTFSGAKTAAMTVPAAASRHGYQYRCKISNIAGTRTTAPATLTVIRARGSWNTVSWVLDCGGLLKLTGSGSVVMDDFPHPYSQDYSSYAWHPYREEIKALRLEGIAAIGQGAFYKCVNLKSVSFSDNLSVIGSFAFYNCTSLEEIDLPYGVKTIKESAFTGSGIRRISLPESLTYIREHAFYYCKNLESIVLPELTSQSYCDTAIGEWTFRDCSSLKSITIPARIKKIDENAFKDCSALTDVYFTGTDTQWNNIKFESGNDDLRNATIHILG